MRVRWLVVTALSMLLVLVWMSNTGSESAFGNYVQQYATAWRSSELRGVPGEDQAWLREHEDLVLAEGRDFCAWMEQFPKVPEVVPSGEADLSRFRSRYMRFTAGTSDLQVNDRTRVGVLAGAGAHLCSDLVDSRSSPAFSEEED